MTEAFGVGGDDPACERSGHQVVFLNETRADTVVSRCGFSKRCPLFLVTSRVEIFIGVYRLDILSNVLRRQAVLRSACKNKILIPAIGFEAIVDIVGGGQIGKDLPPAAFVIDYRDHCVLIAAADTFGPV
jgi:hypothetical protein